MIGNFRAVMLDIETLGIKPGSVIYDIGAVEFSLHDFEMRRELSVRVDVESCVNFGLDVDEATVKWHEEQGLPSPFSKNERSMPLQNALSELNEYIKEVSPSQLWCKGTSFDFPLLEAAYEACGMRDFIPWKYYDLYDMRTIWKMAYPNRKAHAAHGALLDAISQVGQLEAAFTELIGDR